MSAFGIEQKFLRASKVQKILFLKLKNRSVDNKFNFFSINQPQKAIRIWKLLIISVIKPIFFIGKWKKSSFSKLHRTTKILIVYLIKSLSLFYFLPKIWWSCNCFFLSCFWDHQELLRPSKKVQTLDSWPQKNQALGHACMEKVSWIYCYCDVP